jgi:predicted esterase
MAVLGGAVAACGGPDESGTDEGAARLSARPGSPHGSVSTGLTALGLSVGRDGLVYVPAAYDPGVPAPLALLLHGAGRSADDLLNPLRPLADELGLILVAPDSRSSTWDATYATYGPDVDFIDEALRLVFGKCVVDPARVTMAGFSDGATYALGLGLCNGDLVTRIVAFSPGALPPRVAVGKPRLFITHGTQDAVLPIDYTSRAIVPELETAGYQVIYREFDGGHVVPLDLGTEAVRWLVTG